MAYAFDTIRTEFSNSVLYATIDHPPLNLIDAEFVHDLRTMLDQLDDDSSIRTVVFRSADPDFFIPHVDMLHIREYTDEAAKSGGPDDNSLGTLFRRLSEARQVTIAVIEGRARGAGNEFILACDMRFASEDAIIGQPEAGVGVLPGAGALQHITRLAGRGNAMEVLLAADDWHARDAERIGLVNRVLSEDRLMKYVSALAERIAGFPEEAVRLIKRRINAIALPLREDVQVDSSLFQTLARSEDASKRLAYFMAQGLQTRSRTELEFGTALSEYPAHE